MTGLELAQRVLEGEDPKDFLRRASADRAEQLGYAREFTNAYIQAALWSSMDDDGTPMDQIEAELSDETRREMEADCLDFFNAHYDDISSDLSQAGHDFWLTRNHHGAGFWDGDWGDELGKKLTDASHAYGEVNLYVGDDGEIHS